MAQIENTTAMLHGRWHGGDQGDHGGARHDMWHEVSEEKGKPTEKLTVPEFDGEGTNDTDLGRSARSYLRKIQVWLRCTKLPAVPERVGTLQLSVWQGMGLRGRARRRPLGHRGGCLLLFAVDSDPFHGNRGVKGCTNDGRLVQTWQTETRANHQGLQCGV